MRLISLLPLLLLTPTARAQASDIFPDLDYAHNLVLWPPGAAATGAMTRVASGPILGNGTDVVVLAGNRPVVVHSLSFSGGVIELRGPLNDLDVLQPSGAQTMAAVVGVGPGGLSTQRANLATGTFMTTVMGGSLWRHATIVRTGDFSGDGVQDVAGLLFGGGTVQLLMSGPGGPFTVADGFAVTGTVVDLARIDWDSDGRDEIVVMTTTGVDVFDVVTGLSVRSEALTDPAAMTIVEHGDSIERVAVITTANPTQDLYVVSPTAPFLEGPDNSYLDIVSLAAGDCDDDGADELLYQTLDSHGGGLIFNEGPEPLYAPHYDTTATAPMAVLNDSPTVTIGDPAPDNTAGAVMGDFNEDGFTDAMLPIQTVPDGASEPAGFAVRWGGILLDGSTGLHGITSLGSGPPPFHSVVMECAPGAPPILELTLRRLPGNLSAATHVRVLVWRQLDPTDYLEPDALRHYEFALDPAAWDLEPLEQMRIEVGDPGQCCDYGGASNISLQLIANGAPVGRAVFANFGNGTLVDASIEPLRTQDDLMDVGADVGDPPICTFPPPSSSLSLPPGGTAELRAALGGTPHTATGSPLLSPGVTAVLTLPGLLFPKYASNTTISGGFGQLVRLPSFPPHQIPNPGELISVPWLAWDQ